MKKLNIIAAILTIIFLSSCCETTENSQTNPKTNSPENILANNPNLDSDIMTPEVLWTFGRVNNVELSPDKKYILFAVKYYDKEKNKGQNDFYTIPAKGGEAKKITEFPAAKFSAKWRPDGNKIGFLCTKSGSVQLWEMKPDGTDIVQISEIEGGISGFKYSPANSKIIIAREVKLDKTVNDLYSDLPLANARLENDLMYRHWDTWHNFAYSHIFVADYKNGKISNLIDIMEGEKFDSPTKPWGGMEEITYSPDGKNIAYTCKKLKGKEYTLSTNTDIYIYNIETGKTSNLTEGMMGYDKVPLYSPDGKYLAWESMERDGYEADKNRLFIYDFTTKTKKYYLEDYDNNVGHITWSDDSKFIYFISGIKASEEIFRLNIENNEFFRITEGIHNYRTIAIGEDNTLIATKQSMSFPTEIFSYNTKDGKETQISFVNKPILDQLTMGEVTKRWIKTTDNKDMLTWVILPPHFDKTKKYPTLLYCQGGPQGTVSQFWSYRWNFQMMAANDYIIVAPNRRGLPSFGQEWNEQISGDYGGQNMKDYLSAIDELAKEPFVDETKLGAIGASYGGFSVFWLAGHHDKRFKAFISHDGMFNFEAQYLETEEMFFVNWDLGGAFWEKNNKIAQRSYANSPHKFVEKWDTPILIIHGEKDFRITYTQGMSAFNAAVLLDVPAEFLYFPEENHWVLSPQNGILWQRTFYNWLDRWLK
ncbi:MAG: S9 family peptidase [Bacteroidetes bacterium]|nr:S9 family peptidase [Bacteroidota bacterium]MBT6687205.1 S9 family peptidase [Bacteroidota bacterium]MBT7144570.1 S9 family peptidase [Bacteroidota bacterium]MBT7490770.1 S9 family peptidase [Bacteroidota bacterium]